MSGQYLRLYDYNQQAWVAVSDYARSTRLATFAFDLERYWAAYYPDRPFYPQRASWLEPARSPGVDTGVFYRELSPYGRWVQVEGRYVWMPQVERGWRPYTDGRWEYTRRYGWTWVSNEPFGWATYHYGRWAYSNRLGWVWVPGTQWAPAWVAWRGSEDHLAWAPLPPDAGPGFALDDGYDQIPGYYWQVVPSKSFLLPNLVNAILGDDGDRRQSLERSQPIGNATVVNNVVVNNVINIDYVEEKTPARLPRDRHHQRGGKAVRGLRRGGPHLPAAGDRGARQRDARRRAAGRGRCRAEPDRRSVRRRAGHRGSCPGSCCGRGSAPPRRRRSLRTKCRHPPRSSPPPKRLPKIAAEQPGPRRNSLRRRRRPRSRHPRQKNRHRRRARSLRLRPNSPRRLPPRKNLRPR